LIVDNPFDKNKAATDLRLVVEVWFKDPPTSDTVKKVQQFASELTITENVWITHSCEEPMVLKGGTNVDQCFGLGTGTLGGFFRDAANAWYGVTNLHVVEQQGTWMCKHGVYHVGDATNVHANTDSALITIVRGAPACQVKTSAGPVAIAGTAVGNVGDIVWKYGATTGHTTGVITGIRQRNGHRNILVQTNMAQLGRFQYRRNRQFCRGGDSGSFILNAANQVVALLHSVVHDAERWYDVIPGLGPGRAPVLAERTQGTDIAQVLAQYPGKNLC